MILGLGWFGCAAPLSAVPIAGGTLGQRAAVRRELEAFDRAVGPGRLLLTRVSLTPRISAHGGYAGGQVYLRPDVRDEDIGAVVWHEACHALDDVEDRSVAHAEALAPLAARTRERDARRRRREAFAQICGAGPYLSSLGGCDEPGGVLDNALWVRDEVWGGVVEPLPVVSTGPTVTAGAEGRIDGVAPGITDRGPALSVMVDGRSRVVSIDDGAVRTDPTFRFRDAANELARTSARLAPGVRIEGPVGWAAGPGLGWAVAGESAFRVRRVAAWDGARWTLADGCSSPDAQFVAVGGRVLEVWTDGPRLRWR